MGLHAYCIVPAGMTTARTGVEGHRVYAIAHDPIAAWVSEHPQRPAATVEAIRAHDAVVRTAMTELVTPVPLRFGQWLATDSELRGRLAEHETLWDRLLREFAGCVELGLRCRCTAGPSEAPGPAGGRATSGRDYLAQVAARIHARDGLRAETDRLLARVRSAVGPWVRQERTGEEPERSGEVWLAHLVRRADVDAYQTALATLAEQLPEAQLRPSGPWPPYSFAV